MNYSRLSSLSVFIPSSIFILVLSLGCSASHHASEVSDASKTGMTVGQVQREISKGMSSAEVVEALGNPNIVSTDSQGREVWTYDRMSRSITYSNSSGGVWLVLGAVSGNSGSSNSSQTTLTVIVKYDEESKVRDLAYHSSRF
jgi:outer membrane protein assembly factor BamE (lipoprotein component of BamABCDE complex)